MKMKHYSGGFLLNPENGKILLHKRDRKTKINPGKWSLFGGGSKNGETPIETFIREIKEETGIFVSNIQPLCRYFYPPRKIKRNIYYAISGEVDVLIGEGQGFGWFSIGEALDLDLSDEARKDLEFFKN